jgi:leader peptidase (prepilin peptidase)/N-methyltransferase
MLELLVVLLGLIIGSFLNVCIYRLPHNQSVVTPPSHCMVCDTQLHLFDIVPVLSYLVLRGKCRYCNAVVSLRYALVELLTAGMFLWCLEVIGFTPNLIIALIVTAFLIVITFIDYDHQLILDRVLIWFAGIGVAIILAVNTYNVLLEYLGIIAKSPFFTIDVVDKLMAIFIGGGLLLLIAILSRGGMGSGDVKFAAAVGIWLGWKLTLFALLLAFLFGGIGSAFALIFKLKGRKDYIPFGPFIALGVFLSMLYGNDIIRYYMQQFL